MSEASKSAQPALTEYEKCRARNIARNNKRLRELGLISALEEKVSNDAALGIHASASSIGGGKKRKTSPSTPLSPTRKSTRLQGLDPDGKPLEDMPPPTTSHEERRRQRQAIIEECREARQLVALRVMEAGAEQAAKENPTATYEHCLMRVRTMSDKGLRNRVKAIERAAGKHCVVKMALFKSCLQDEDMWDIAELATQALERLKALQAPPDE